MNENNGSSRQTRGAIQVGLFGRPGSGPVREESTCLICDSAIPRVPSATFFRNPFVAAANAWPFIDGSGFNTSGLLQIQ